MEDRVYGYFQGDPPQYENMPLCVLAHSHMIHGLPLTRNKQSCVSSACSHSSLILTVVCVPKQMRYYNLNGYAAVRAYTAYGNEEFLDFAVRAWEFERNNTVSISDVPLPLQNSSFKELYDAYRQCDNCEMPPLPQLMSNLTDHISLSGQFGWRTDGTMASSDNGLSSLLAEITGNNTFLEAAMESEEFILSQLYDDGSLLKWGISMDENNPCQLATKEDVDPWNAGYAIAGLAIMSSTYPANETIRQKRVSGSSSLRLSPSDWIYRLTNTILAATSFLAWHDGQGVMASVEKAGDMDLISGLFTAHTRDAVDSGLSSYLQGYLAVQYNAILDLATNNGTDIYGLAWIGPPPIEYSAQDQIIAAHVLVAGIGINSTDDTTDDVSPVLPVPARKAFPVGGIVGAVLGGLLGLVGVSVFIICRKRRRAPIQEHITPFRVDVPNKRHLNHHRSSKKAQASMRVEPRRTAMQPQPTSGPSPASNEMTREELVQMLNQRLQPERWNNNEQPPSYV
ncbi:endo- -alpha-mannosidase [Moniliophthora roreri MCA 2997]|uniref:Endo--alpha-mannosidase n=1 Tax=Moniliophthora roreri (strain MCA 2997) TaxID=1381753 RepID=V2Y591_MONRO|nr:endo- -alpha-mannosidase [Moniliophthora roreri MCA 2997]